MAILYVYEISNEKSVIVQVKWQVLSIHLECLRVFAALKFSGRLFNRKEHNDGMRPNPSLKFYL